jgi:hypothetical protein
MVDAKWVNKWDDGIDIHKCLAELILGDQEVE